MIGSVLPRRRWASPRRTPSSLAKCCFSCSIVYYAGWFLGRAPRMKRTLFGFVKLWISVNGTQRCGIRLYDIHRFFGILMEDKRNPGF